MRKQIFTAVRVAALAFLLSASTGCSEERSAAVPSPLAQEVAAFAVERYGDRAVEMLADLVAFETYHPSDLEYTEHPEFSRMRDYLERTAAELGFDFEDLGPLVVIGLGDSPDRVGVVAHGDVQPVDASKWARNPFTLDATSEPGRLVARGTEDDKGPLVNALLAMKAIRDNRIPLDRRIELIVAWTEERSWTPIRELLETWKPPQINIAFDANYPVVVAEKGWGQIEVTFPETPTAKPESPILEAFAGGAFLSQVPENATAIIANPTVDLRTTLESATANIEALEITVSDRDDGRLLLTAHGESAHSSIPWNGTNAITHLAALLGELEWSDTAAARAVRFTNDLVGTGHYAERFGDLAYSHPFMGELTLTLATIKEADAGSGLTAGISFRRPAGRSREQVTASVEKTLTDWTTNSGLLSTTWEAKIYDPYQAGDAPQIPILLDVFAHYAGVENPEPIAIGGGTNASLLPNGVSFGPSMPGAVYTGHSEHEFITEEQFRLDLEMYTAALVELAGQ